MAEGTCVFPGNFWSSSGIDSWYDSHQGTLNFTSTTLSGWQVWTIGAFTFTCDTADQTYYVLRYNCYFLVLWGFGAVNLKLLMLSALKLIRFLKPLPIHGFVKYTVLPYICYRVCWNMRIISGVSWIEALSYHFLWFT